MQHQATLIKNLISLPEWKGVAMLWNPNSQRTLLALGAEAWIDANKIDQLDVQSDWWFGYISYDYKNKVENLHHRHEHPMGFAPVQFFKPQAVISFENKNVEVLKNSSSVDFDFTLSSSVESSFHSLVAATQAKESYIEAVNKLKEHIKWGNIYEVNYCQTFEANYKAEAPFDLFVKLNDLTEAPYASYLALGRHHVLCASPESFIEKKGSMLYSSPIKGTVKRGATAEEDESLKSFLRNDKKEQAENVMIVDLVRNDLSKVATKNSVEVEELFGIYSFKTVHHMISTVKCELKEKTTFAEILKALFPMGSMTGAPKISAMNLIDDMEVASRGVYSGSLGVIYPNGDFDFNVVIRTLLYDSQLELLRCSVGGAITALCEAEREYEECLLKGKAVMYLPFE
ncbi:MAG: aminodeoxychorismate synthase component I [Flavobacteriales bacterium]